MILNKTKVNNLNTSVKKIFLEPFFHFILMGVALYFFYDISQETDISSKEVIKISSSDIAQLKSKYKNSFNKDATSVEIAYLVKNLEYEKILLKEAKTLNLDTQDSIITKRLIDKMHYIMNEQGSKVEPSEEELLSFYKMNMKEYSQIQTLSFSHIYLNTNEIIKAQKLLSFIKNSNLNPKDASSFSDTFSRGNSEKDINFNDLKESYGNYFAKKVVQLKSNTWSQPLHSKDGIHLVYIRDKIVSFPYSFDEVQDRVYSDYIEELKNESIKLSYKKLTSQYRFIKNK